MIVPGRITAWCLLLLLTLVAPAHAHELLTLDGHVQWISGHTMIMATNANWMDPGFPWALWSIRVDLRRVPQHQYAALRQGDLVTVSGVLSAHNNLLIGRCIEQVERWTADWR